MPLESRERHHAYAAGMSHRDRSTDKRFKAVIAHEFGEDLSLSNATAPKEDSFNTQPRDTPDRAAHEPFNFSAAMEAADPYPDDGYSYSPEPLPAPQASHQQWWGWALLLAGVGVGLVALFGVPVPRFVGIISGVIAIGGLAILLWKLTHRPTNTHDDNDGAQL